MSYRSFYQVIKENKLKSLYLFHGEEMLLVDRLLSMVQKQLLNPNVMDFNYMVTDGDAMSFEQAFGLAEMLPVMDDRRVVVIKNPAFVIKSEWTDDQIERYISYHQDLESVTTFLICPEIDKRKKIVKQIAKIGEVVCFNRLDEKDMIKWVGQESSRMGKGIDQATAHYLVDRLGYHNKEAEVNLYEISHLIKQLAHGAQGDQISKSQIENLLKQSVESNIFTMIDGLFDKRPRVAFEQFNALLDHGEVPIKVLFMIHRQIRQMVQVKQLHLNGYSQQAIAQTLDLKPFMVKKTMRQVQGLSLESIRQMLYAAEEADGKMKRSSLDPRILVESLMAKITALSST